MQRNIPKIIENLRWSLWKPRRKKSPPDAISCWYLSTQISTQISNTWYKSRKSNGKRIYSSDDLVVF